MKVVQILYSYLLSRSEFKVEEAPVTTSRDRRFAYKMYIDTLLLILRLSGQRVGDYKPLGSKINNKYLSSGEMANALATDDVIRHAILRDSQEIAVFEPLVEKLMKEITSQAVYRSYVRIKERSIADDVRLWTTIVETVFARSAEFKEAARSFDEFTNRGFDNGLQMVVNTLNSFSDNRSLLGESKNSLERSLDKAYELYISLLLLPIAITRLEEDRIETARNKHLPSADDLNPNERFVNNRFVADLLENEDLKKYIENTPISWSNEPILLRSLLDSIHQSEFYQEYMNSKEDSLAQDCEFWRQVMRTIILPSDELAEMLESTSVYWNDDLEIMGTFVQKSIRRFEIDGANTRLLPKYKDEEDARFAEELFTYAARNVREYRSLIDRFINTAQWDSERLALMDIVVMIAAIAELENYPQIPATVTLNEYIEIANSYSTPKSGQFINGILSSVIAELNAEGRINKTLA